jgi:saccharopine dehydrogenase-like NADP-dependent oxidoreductase
MARTTGYTCTGMLECLLDGSWTKVGVTPPERVGQANGLWDKIRTHLAARQVCFEHSVE